MNPLIAQMLGPQPDAQTTLQTNDREHLGPGLPRHQSRDHPVVDPGSPGNGANAPLPHRSFQVDHEQTHGLSISISARRVRPRRSHRAWLRRGVSAHGLNLRPREILPNRQPGLDLKYGVQYHHSDVFTFTSGEAVFNLVPNRASR